MYKNAKSMLIKRGALDRNRATGYSCIVKRKNMETTDHRIWDIHSHILPGMDDGSQSLEESLEMLRQAAEEGITDVIATPHCSGRYPAVDPREIRRSCRQLQRKAGEELGSRIRIWPGQEIMYTEENAALLRQGRLMTLCGSRHVLIEFFPSVPYSYLYQAVREVILDGYRPVLAHAERYECLHREGRLEEIRSQGAKIQMNTRSVGGKWFDAATRWCRRVLRKELVDYIGTDMHNTGSRSPQMRQAADWMEKHLDSLYFRKLTRGNPAVFLKEKEQLLKEG